MASTARAYNNSPPSPSGKTDSLSPFRLAEIVRYSGVPRHLRATILAALAASDGAGIILWPAIKGIMIEAGVSRRTVQRNRRRLVQEGYWLLERSANTWDAGHTNFRRPATYKLNVTKLASIRRPKEIHSSDWRTYREYKTVTRQRPQHDSAHEAKKPAAPVVPMSPPLPPAPAAPLRVPANPAAHDVHRSTERKLPSLTSRQRAELVRRIPIFMKGRTQFTEAHGGYGYALKPEDPRYLAPMDKRSAILAACRSMCQGDDAHNLRAHGVSMTKALEAAADAGFKVETESGP
jgi:hypothetical protein